MDIIAEAFLYFILWTFVLYWIHRLAHVLPIMSKYHWNHHTTVNENKHDGKFMLRHLLIYVDSWETTVDQWLTEVIPTLLFSWITGQWWISVFYYIDAAFIQESVEHNPKINLYPWFTGGKWHLTHHKEPDKNYGVFFPIWDFIFNTESKANV